MQSLNAHLYVFSKTNTTLDRVFLTNLSNYLQNSHGSRYRVHMECRHLKTRLDLLSGRSAVFNVHDGDA